MEDVQIEPSLKHKTAWKIIGLLALVLIILLVWQSTENNQSNNLAIEPENNQNQSLNENQSVNENFNVENVPTSELPAGIPMDIPLEENVVIVQNDVITSKENPGQTQYTRKFVSNRSLDANYLIYKDFLNANNWEVVSSVEQETLMSLIAVNPDKTRQLFITVSENTISGEVTVDLTVVVQE